MEKYTVVKKGSVEYKGFSTALKIAEGTGMSVIGYDNSFKIDGLVICSPYFLGKDTLASGDSVQIRLIPGNDNFDALKYAIDAVDDGGVSVIFDVFRTNQQIVEDFVECTEKFEYFSGCFLGFSEDRVGDIGTLLSSYIEDNEIQGEISQPEKADDSESQLRTMTTQEVKEEFKKLGKLEEEEEEEVMSVEECQINILRGVVDFLERVSKKETLSDLEKSMALSHIGTSTSIGMFLVSTIPEKEEELQKVANMLEDVYKYVTILASKGVTIPEVRCEQ